MSFGGHGTTRTFSVAQPWVSTGEEVFHNRAMTTSKEADAEPSGSHPAKGMHNLERQDATGEIPVHD